MTSLIWLCTSGVLLFLALVLGGFDGDVVALRDVLPIIGPVSLAAAFLIVGFIRMQWSMRKARFIMIWERAIYFVGSVCLFAVLAWAYLAGAELPWLAVFAVPPALLLLSIWEY